MAKPADGLEPSAGDGLDVKAVAFAFLLGDAEPLRLAERGIDCRSQQRCFSVCELGVCETEWRVVVLVNREALVALDDGPGAGVGGLRSCRATSLAVSQPVQELRCEDIGF